MPLLYFIHLYMHIKTILYSQTSDPIWNQPSLSCHYPSGTSGILTYHPFYHQVNSKDLLEPAYLLFLMPFHLIVLMIVKFCDMIFNGKSRIEIFLHKYASLTMCWSAASAANYCFSPFKFHVLQWLQSNCPKGNYSKQNTRSWFRQIF